MYLVCFFVHGVSNAWIRKGVVLLFILYKMASEDGGLVLQDNEMP